MGQAQKRKLQLLHVSVPKGDENEYLSGFV